MRKPNTNRNDALNYLPRRPLTEYGRGQVIYSGACEGLFLVVSGRVKVASVAIDGSEAIVRIVPSEGLFGECSLIERPAGERATALDRVQLMTWKRAEIEQQIEREPKLGLALIEGLISAGLDLQERMQAMASYKTPQRVMLSLLQLADSLGRDKPDGALEMSALTHHVIAEHVGTSREIVSSQMSRLRRLGMVRYTRRTLEVYPDALEEALRSEGITLKRMPASAAGS
jgi:CRP-like cAMP-binding protein